MRALPAGLNLMQLMAPWTLAPNDPLLSVGDPAPGSAPGSIQLEVQQVGLRLL